MNFEKFVRKIEGVRQQTDLLHCSVNQAPQQQQQLLMQAVEQLSVSLEELHVAEEELLQQNEQLVEYQTEIEKERQRYQELFDFAPDGYIVTDINGKILEANQAASQLLRIEKKRLIGKLLVVFVPQETRREFRQQLHNLYSKKQLKNWEINLQNNQGILFDCEISASLINENQGNCIGIRWLLRNISLRKQAEKKIRCVELQNLQLQEAAQLKSKIVTVLSHELRTPLNAIIGFSDVLLRLNKNEFTPQCVTIIQRIKKNGKHLLTMINSMLDFAKLEEGKLNIKLQKFSIEELARRTVEELSFFAEQKSLKLEVNTNLTNNIVTNDSIRLKQILTNLIFNAIKFTEVGSILVELQEINQDQIIIIVKDTGIGISEIDLKYIFQAFRQGDQTINRSYEGTGLGLAIVKDLLNLMGGTIAVESVLGEGSTFRVELPRTVIGNW
ncbi:MAG: ATP-binding protein [Nostocales cyanobacterium 94392]|nr:ATP-binding protein [Nostocales cyanobacterium 94392]